MDFLVDVHLPIGLSKFLGKQANCSSIHVNQILQRWYTTDAEICKYADENNLIVITKDSDFKNSHFLKNTPKKVIRVILGNVTTRDLITIFDKHFRFIFPLLTEDCLYLEIGKEQITIINPAR